MVWEWGEDVLSNSTSALMRVLDETGLKAGLNFDGKGIEYLAATDSVALEKIRSAIESRRLELWGGTYAQPYGGLIGHESNVRQRQLGIQAFQNALGLRPTLFCEEELDFFPQLPQLLGQLGYSGAFLFPQHTWHTPTFPVEESKAIRWRGIDGSSIPAIPYSRRCLMRGIPTAIKRIREIEESEPLIVTWLEMLDKPNWMWRTDFALKFLKELAAQSDFEVKPILLSEYLLQHQENAPTRDYTVDEYFHGICVGKNGDGLIRLWQTAEATILRAEFLASWCSFLGQPYPQFDSYPEWRLNEAWRNLCISQAHDSYECQGLTNFAGTRYGQMAQMLAKDVVDACEKRLAGSASNGFEIDEVPFGESIPRVGDDGLLRSEILSSPFGMPEGWEAVEGPALRELANEQIATIPIKGPEGEGVLKWRIVTGRPPRGQLILDLFTWPQKGILGAVKLPLRLKKAVRRFRIDTPFAVVDAHPKGKWLYRQPKGHWLTSEQEDYYVERPLSLLNFVALEDEAGRGCLYATKQSRLAFAREDGIDSVLFAYDAWDGENWQRRATFDFSIAEISSPTNAALLQLTDALISADTFAFRGKRFFKVFGPAHLTCVKKLGEFLEMRLFETEGNAGEAEIEFQWPIESSQQINLLGEVIDEQRIEVAGRKMKIRLKPRQLCTLRILFEGKRTEYLEIDSFREIWVGG